MNTGTARPETLLGGRYLLADVLAAGGMATVHIGRLVGEGGFSRTVAIKRLHPQFVHNPEFVQMFLDEARLVARIRHPNVVPTLDVVSLENELFLVMELVVGESLSRLQRSATRQGVPMPIPIVSGVMVGALHGLHAAHEARDELGNPLAIVHRDISPHNILVGTDGIPRLIDFGVAKAIGQGHLTRDGQIKGKVSYMSPEQMRSRPLDRRSDVYAAGVVLWELLACRRLFQADDDVSSVVMALDGVKDPPSAFNPGAPRELDAVVMRALSPDPALRFATARDMAVAIEQVVPCASAYTIGVWVEERARDEIDKRSAAIARLESSHRAASAAPASAPASAPALPPAAPASPALSAPAGDSSAVNMSLVSEPRWAVGQGRTRLLSGLGALVGVLVGGLWFAQRAPVAPPAAAPSSPEPPSAAASASTPPEPPPPPAASSAASTKKKTPAKEPGDAGAKGKPAKTAVDCSNPYTKGADGILRVKPGCL